MSYWHQIFFIRCCADLCIVPTLHFLFDHPVNNHHTTLGLPSMDGILVLSCNAQSNVVLVHVAPARPCWVLSFSWYLNEVSSLTIHQLWSIFSTCGDQPTWEVFISSVIPLNFWFTWKACRNLFKLRNEFPGQFWQITTQTLGDWWFGPIQTKMVAQALEKGRTIYASCMMLLFPCQLRQSLCIHC